MSEVRIRCNGSSVTVPAGTTVAAALLNHGTGAFRRGSDGAARAPLCGMGTCFECRVVIDGDAHRRACMELVRDGMVIDTDA